MSVFDRFFSPSPCPPEAKKEVADLINELVRIGHQDDYLSVTPGGGYNAQCRHVRTRQIGDRINKIGGLKLMSWVFEKVHKKVGKVLASHLEYAWNDIGEWRA